MNAACDDADPYVELLKLGLLDLLGPTTARARPRRRGRVKIEPVPEIERSERMVGRDWPANGMTMIGWERLSSLQRCVEEVIARGIEGDMIETGVWRGGAAILMRALLKRNGTGERKVWVADSFTGLPPPDARTFPADAGDRHHAVEFLSVSEEEVRRNFARYGVLDDGVRFLPGWFRDTLPTLSDQLWSLIRLDGDMYESTMVALECLYPRLSPGGFAVIDDYGAVEACRQAVHDYREQHAVDDEIERIDWTGVLWRKSAASGP
jgi:O-methyltransferase